MKPAPIVASVLLLGLTLLGPTIPADGPDAFPPNVRVTTPNGPANEVHIAVNPVDAQNLIAGSKDYTLGLSNDCGKWRVWAGVYWTKDGGLTWGNTLIPGYPGGPPSLLTGYRCVTDPVVAFDGLGRAYFLGLAYNGPATASTLFLATSPDGGATWTVTNLVGVVPELAWFNDKEWFAVDPATGTAYITWSQFHSGTLGSGIDILFVRCVVGAACSSPETLTDPNVGESVQGSYPVVGPDGAVNVIWLDYGRGQLRFTRSTNLGLTFSAPKSIAAFNPISTQPNGAFRTPTLPALGVDRGAGPDSGNLYAVWSDDRFDVSDVLLVRSADDGATWSTAIRVNNDPLGKSNFFPAIDVAENGRVDVAFYDRRDDPANRLLTAYLASSADGGVTWTNTRVGDAQFNGNLGFHQSGAAFIGDYIGVASTDDRSVPIWADTRLGRSDAFVALVPR